MVNPLRGVNGITCNHLRIPVIVSVSPISIQICFGKSMQNKCQSRVLPEGPWEHWKCFSGVLFCLNSPRFLFWIGIYRDHVKPCYEFYSIPYLAWDLGGYFPKCWKYSIENFDETQFNWKFWWSAIELQKVVLFIGNFNEII